MHFTLLLSPLLLVIPAVFSAALDPEYAENYKRIVSRDPQSENQSLEAKLQERSDPSDEWVEDCNSIYANYSPYVLGRKIYQLECGVQHHGYEFIDDPEWTTYMFCANLCELNDECVAFTLDMSQTIVEDNFLMKGYCILQSYVSERQGTGRGKKYANWVSGKYIGDEPSQSS
jgi:hypothetical protein